MYSIDIKNNKEIYDYCMHNGITDINKFVQDCFKQGYDIKKYGFLGKTLNEGEKNLNKEVIVEKRVEIPVEVIKEVEIIKEVPVEKEVIKEVVREIPVEKVVIQEVIKEIPVDRVIEKEVYISDNTQVNELLLKIQQLENEMSKKDKELNELRREFSTKTIEMENIFQNEMSKKNKQLDELRHSLDNLEQNDKIKLLQETLQKLRKEISEKNTKIEELEKINGNININTEPQRAIFLKGSNLTQKI